MMIKDYNKWYLLGLPFFIIKTQSNSLKLTQTHSNSLKLTQAGCIRETYYSLSETWWYEGVRSHEFDTLSCRLEVDTVTSSSVAFPQNPQTSHLGNYKEPETTSKQYLHPHGPCNILLPTRCNIPYNTSRHSCTSRKIPYTHNTSCRHLVARYNPSCVPLGHVG